MDSWLRQSAEVLDILLRRPDSALERGVLFGASALIFVVVYNRVCRSVNVSNSGPLYGAILFVLGGLLVVAGVAAAGRFVAPRFGLQDSSWLLPGSLLAVSLLVVAPVICAVQKADYLSALMAWGFSVVAVALVVFGLSAVFEGLRGGEQSLERTRRRTEEVNTFLKSQ
jgi:hypothetical protein